MTHPRLGPLTLALSLSLSSCAPRGSDTATLPQLTATRSTEFGDKEGEGALSNVWGVAVSRDGQVFLSEPQFARVVAFNADGTFARVVGERGDGPGEFRIPGALTWKGDSLAVTDFQRGINLFSPDGTFQTIISFNINDGTSPFGVRPILPLADGSVAALAPASNSGITDGAKTEETWLKASRDGVILDTLCVMSLEGSLFSVRYQERRRSSAHPVSWAPLFTATPAGTSLVIVERAPATSGETATYRVVRLGPDGDTLGTAALPYDPVPLTTEQIDSISASLAVGWAESIGAEEPAVAAAIAEQVVWPDYQPPVTTVLAGDDGSIWLRREIVGTPSARWDILDADLAPVGWVDLPIPFDVKVVSHERIYGIELDELDVPRIVRFDISGR